MGGNVRRICLSISQVVLCWSSTIHIENNSSICCCLTVIKSRVLSLVAGVKTGEAEMGRRGSLLSSADGGSPKIGGSLDGSSERGSQDIPLTSGGTGI